MLILHISDIHFQSPGCLDPWRDPHNAIRTRMTNDLAEQVVRLGKVGALLIGGDVAFKAAADEYATALTWIQELSNVCGCPKERIFVVPGNHDVDRKLIETNVSIQNVQAAISSAASARRDSVLERQLSDEQSGQNLFLPHAEYNLFAAQFGCQIWPGKPHWHQDIELEDGVNLRIYGLTSTLLSGRGGLDDNKGDLFLGIRQTVLNPVPNTANLVLVHHPLDWLADGDPVDEALSSRASFHLFGHKHKQRAVREASYVRLGAGAVNPSLEEKPYEPGYNLIDLKVDGAGQERGILVELHQRRLQAEPELFVPIRTSEGLDVFVARIPLRETPSIHVAPSNTSTRSSPPKASEANVKPSTEDAEAAMGEPDTRDLLYRFWQLDSSQRREIAQSLDLLRDGEMKLPEPERYGRALIRASEQNIMAEVAAAVRRVES